MSIFTKMFTGVLLSGILVCTTQMAHADSKKKVLKNLDEAKISLQKAVEIAESHQGGKAYSAELEDDSFSVEYEVKIINETRRVKITVDGVTGEIKRVR